MIRAHLRRYGARDRTRGVLSMGEPQPEARRADTEVPASVSEPR
jgi:hypothetical protein